MLNTYKRQFAKILHTQLKERLSEDEIFDLIEIPPENIQGDLAFPCFQLSKIMKNSPIEIAKQINEHIRVPMDADEFSMFFVDSLNVGPYVNAVIDTALLVQDVLPAVFDQKEKYGAGSKKDETILVESPGPNTNKPLHIGHVRNLLLGNALVEVLNFAGYDAKRIDIINDRGIHICKSMLAYQKFGDNQQPDKKSDHFVGDRYVKYAQEVEQHPEMEDTIKEMLIKWEDGDPEVRALREQMNSWAISGMQETYKRYGTHIEKAYYEHEHYLSGKDIVLDAYKKGIFVKDEKDNIVYDTGNEATGKKAVLRSDGTSIYSTQDIGLAHVRYQDYHMDRMIYVVGNEQKEYFEILFQIFKSLEYPFAEKCFHMSYGMISVPGGKIKSREGTKVDADTIADEVKNIAQDTIKERYPDLSVEEIDYRAEAIAMGAIKFFMLKYEVAKNFVFDPQESLSFEGETGPYVQYTYARINALIKKGNTLDPSTGSGGQLTGEIFGEGEKQVILKLAEFGSIVEKAAEEYKPNLIVRYLLDLAKSFNYYYQHTKILVDTKKEQEARLLLVIAVQQVMGNAMNLLGIEKLEEM